MRYIDGYFTVVHLESYVIWNTKRGICNIWCILFDPERRPKGNIEAWHGRHRNDQQGLAGGGTGEHGFVLYQVAVAPEDRAGEGAGAGHRHSLRTLKDRHYSHATPAQDRSEANRIRVAR